MGTLRKAGEVTFGLTIWARVVQFDLLASCLFGLVEANPAQESRLLAVKPSLLTTGEWSSGAYNERC
jgi:hypothetical protein